MVFLEISQNSQEKTCARNSFLIKFQEFYYGIISQFGVTLANKAVFCVSLLNITAREGYISFLYTFHLQSFFLFSKTIYSFSLDHSHLQTVPLNYFPFFIIMYVENNNVVSIQVTLSF